MKRISRLETLIVAIVLLTSLAARLTGLSAFRVEDEMTWTCRSVSFRAALLQGDWANTFRVGHPGVITTWLGAVFAPPASDSVQAACQAGEDGKQLDRVGGSPAELHQLLTAVDRLLVSARVGPALFSWL